MKGMWCVKTCSVISIASLLVDLFQPKVTLEKVPVKQSSGSEDFLMYVPVKYTQHVCLC